MSRDKLVIEDDDGFRTEWPWPDGLTMLANSEFVKICEAQHDALRLDSGLS
jgi:hypothetical protein